MRSVILIDTGPLVAYLRASEQHHTWAVEQFKQYARPLLTCEPVIVEAAFLLRRSEESHEALLGLFGTRAIACAFSLEAHAASISDLMSRYADLPMDLADACLVRMAEQHPHSQVLTLDGDFHIYRKHRHHPIPLLMPA